MCQVCNLYSQTNGKISEVYEDSKRLAEKKIKAKRLELEALEIAEIKGEEEIDLSIDEFEEEEEEVPLKFEKRKAGKAELEDTEALEVECPYCGELFDDLATHVQNCEFAPEDASLEDVLPSKTKRKKKGGAKETSEEEESKEAKKCPYCGKEFQRLARHLNSCKKRPKGAKEEEEEEYDEDEEENDEEEDEEEEDFDDE